MVNVYVFKQSENNRLIYIFVFIAALEKGIVMYDARSKSDVFVQCPVLFVACDNPRASEFCRHMGSSTIYFCRICDVSLEANKLSTARNYIWYRTVK